MQPNTNGSWKWQGPSSSVTNEFQAQNMDITRTGWTDSSNSMLPFEPPEAVQNWLRPEDWLVLAKAWEAAETRTLTKLMQDDLVEDRSSVPRRAPRRQNQKPWKEDWSFLGNDHRLNVLKRRYFDDLPKEASMTGREAVRPGLVSKDPELDQNGKPWDPTHTSLASSDNTSLHPFLRHYFDCRGLEASVRMRPHVDHPAMRKLPSRVPGRPTTAEKMARWSTDLPESQSLPSLHSQMSKMSNDENTLDTANRHKGSITWGGRCLMAGPDVKVQYRPSGEKIPWVCDHHRTEAEDNAGLHPRIRHYFDADGCFTSFRNRGRHHGKPIPSVFGKSFGKSEQFTSAGNSMASTDFRSTGSQHLPSVRHP